MHKFKIICVPSWGKDCATKGGANFSRSPYVPFHIKYCKFIIIFCNSKQIYQNYKDWTKPRMSVRKCFILKCRTVSLITCVRLNKMIQIKILTIFNFDRIVEIAIVIRIRETDLSINSFSRNQGVLSVHPSTTDCSTMSLRNGILWNFYSSWFHHSVPSRPLPIWTLPVIY